MLSAGKRLCGREEQCCCCPFPFQRDVRARSPKDVLKSSGGMLGQKSWYRLLHVCSPAETTLDVASHTLVQRGATWFPIQFTGCSCCRLVYVPSFSNQSQPVPYFRPPLPRSNASRPALLTNPHQINKTPRAHRNRAPSIRLKSRISMLWLHHGGIRMGRADCSI